MNSILRFAAAAAVACAAAFAQAAPVRVDVAASGEGARAFEAYARRHLKAALAEEGRGVLKVVQTPGSPSDCTMAVALGARVERPVPGGVRYLQPYAVKIRDFRGRVFAVAHGTADWSSRAETRRSDPSGKICEIVCRRAAGILLGLFKPAAKAAP